MGARQTIRAEDARQRPVSVIVGDLSAGNPITVSIEYDYDVLTPIIAGFVPDGVITMRSVVSQAIINTDF